MSQNPTSSNSFVWMLSGLVLYILYFESFIIYRRPYSDFTLSLILRIKKHSNETYDNATKVSKNRQTCQAASHKYVE